MEAEFQHMAINAPNGTQVADSIIRTPYIDESMGGRIMKRILSIVFLASMFLTTPALAGDVEDIKAAETDFRAKESAGNVEGYFAYKAPTYSIFPLSCRLA